MSYALTRYTPPQWRILGMLHAKERQTHPVVPASKLLSAQDADVTDLARLEANGLIELAGTDGKPTRVAAVNWAFVKASRARTHVVTARITAAGSKTVWDQPEIMIVRSIHRPPRGSSRKYPADQISRSSGVGGADFTTTYKQMIADRLATLYTADGEEMTPDAVDKVKNIATADYRCGLTRKGTAYLERWR